MPVFDPAAYARLIEAERATVLVLVPAMLGMVLQCRETSTANVSSVRTVAYGGAPISEAVLSATFARFECGVIQMFGMTETNAAGTILNFEDNRNGRLRSCGRPFRVTKSVSWAPPAIPWRQARSARLRYAAPR